VADVLTEVEQTTAGTQFRKTEALFPQVQRRGDGIDWTAACQGFELLCAPLFDRGWKALHPDAPGLQA
jgi:hypothetical protein